MAERPDDFLLINDTVDVQTSAAIQLATGALFHGTDMPPGLKNAWNDAVRSGCFIQCKTIGDMAREFLFNQLRNL